MLFSPKAELSTISINRLAKFENLHTVSLLYKLLSSTDTSTGLPYGFDSFITRRRHEITINKEAGQKRNIYNRIRLIGIFGFVDQEKSTYGLGCHLILKRDTSNNAIHRTAATAEAKLFVKNIA